MFDMTKSDSVLDRAVPVCDDPAPVPLERLEQRDQASEPPARHRVQVYEPEGWPGRIRQYYDEHAARA
jgi:hypothetical protein